MHADKDKRSMAAMLKKTLQHKKTENYLNELLTVILEKFITEDRKDEFIYFANNYNR